MEKLKIFSIKVLIISFPLWLMLTVYLLTDPFKVLYSYHFGNYFDWQPWELNREMVGTVNLKERMRKNDVPDSYILGNSRSLVYRCDTWESFLTVHSKPFHFDAAAESLYGVYKKVEYLDKQNIRIRNVLLICDYNLLYETENNYRTILVKYPDISGESKFAYQTNFLKAYFTDFFCIKQIDYLLFGKVRNYMTDIFAFNPGYVRTEPYNNDYFYQKYDSMLSEDSLGYYVYKKDVFPDRPAYEETNDIVIKAKQIAMLKKIKQVFDRNKTRVKIVISPLYNQQKINEADIKTLVNIFGGKTVYDYSGKNTITDFKGNYYESSHYKPGVAQKILSDIYKN
jgi:hypothetical protein